MKQSLRTEALNKNHIRVLILKKNSYLVARIVLFDTAGLYLLTFRILEPYSSKDIELDLYVILRY